MYSSGIDPGMVSMRKMLGLTLRQSELLISLAKRKKELGLVKLSDLIYDMGVGYATLADHLNKLKELKLVKTPNDKKPMNLGFEDKIFITDYGEQLAKKILSNLDITYSHASEEIFKKLETKFSSNNQIPLFGGRVLESFSKSFEQLIEKNSLEPIMTSIAMYTELDSTLNLLKNTKYHEYLDLSVARLHLEIRNGRLASITLPIAIRQNIRYPEVRKVLGNSWSWLKTVNNTSIRRYWQEAYSLGLYQIRGELLTSTKPTSTNIVQWLSQKTSATFINTFSMAPKSSLVIFKEAFNFPTEEEILNPHINDNLKWLNSLYDGIADKDEYRTAINEGLKIVGERTKLVQDYEGKLIPNTIIREVNGDENLSERFRHILKNPDKSMEKILIAINSKPGITKSELIKTIRRENENITPESIKELISVMIRNNLIYTAIPASGNEGDERLTAFSHYPYFGTNAGETTATLRNLKPYLLQKINDIFETNEELESLIRIFQKLKSKNTLSFDEITSEDKGIGRKMIALSQHLDPFIIIDKDYSHFSIKESTNNLSELMISSLLYSIMTQEDSLAIYSQMIGEFVEKDIPLREELNNEARDILDKFISKNMKRIR